MSGANIFEGKTRPMKEGERVRRGKNNGGMEKEGWRKMEIVMCL